MTEGWKCPACGMIWSPTTDQCVPCNTRKIYAPELQKRKLNPQRDREAEASRLDAENLRGRVPPVKIP